MNVTQLPSNVVPCDNYADCGNATDAETAYYDWFVGYEGDKTEVVVCPSCMNK